jgi:hypothetical protein
VILVRTQVHTKAIGVTFFCDLWFGGLPGQAFCLAVPEARGPHRAAARVHLGGVAPR